MYVVTMFSTIAVIIISLCAVEILAVDGTCPTPNNGSLIENCCNLMKSKEFAFSEITVPVNNPKVYKFKNFCDKNCTTVIINGYCDTLTDGGGWLVVQRRTNGSENFHRNWNDYEVGFGNLTGELWYGLRALHCLTKQGKWELRIDFTFSNGTKSFMHYNHFRVGPATDNYRLRISGFTGITPIDILLLHRISMDNSSVHMIEIMIHGMVIVHSMNMVVNQVDGGIINVITSTSTTTIILHEKALDSCT